MSEIKQIRVERIFTSAENPRQTFDEESLKNLAESIKNHGLIEPIVVRPRGELYELVVGERRLRAAQLAGLLKITAKVENIDDLTCSEYRLIENTQREDLTEPEKGNAVFSLWKNYPEKYPTYRTIAVQLNKSAGTLERWLRASQALSDHVKELLFSDAVSDRQTRFITKFSQKEQDRLVDAILRNNIPSTDHIIRKFIESYETDPSADLDELAKRAKSVRTAKVEIGELSDAARKEVEDLLERRKEKSEANRKLSLKKALRSRAARKAWETRRKPIFSSKREKQDNKALSSLLEKVGAPGTLQTEREITLRETRTEKDLDILLTKLAEMEANEREKAVERMLRPSKKQRRKPPKPEFHTCPRCETPIWLGWDYIALFDKTPKDIVCPHFYELRWAFGCPYNCSYCYLQGTFYGNKTPRFKYKSPEEKERLANELRYFFDFNKPYPERFVLNTGELADSLMDEGSKDPFSKFIIPIFEEQDKHKVLFLTKSDRVENLVEIESHKQAIVSFSINAPEVATTFEVGAPPTDRRIEAAGILRKAEYEDVRVRIDPIIPVEGWEKCYQRLIDQIFSTFVPTRITLGSIRGLSKTLRFARGDTSWRKWLVEESGWGLKIEDGLRERIYHLVIDYLRDAYDYKKVALCKETASMWNKLGLASGSYPNWKECKCNCVW